MENLNQLSTKYWTLPYLLLAEKLHGVDTDQEKAEDFDSIEEYCIKMKMDAHRATNIVCQMELYVILGNWEAAAEKLGTEDIRSLVPGLMPSLRYTLLEPLILLKQAQGELSLMRKRKLKKRAVKAIKILRGWAKKGNVNVVHYVHMAEVELAVVNGKSQKAEESFKSAITVASRNGYVQDRALSHELASQWFALKGDDYWKDYHLDNAIRYYEEWGASVKVSQLKSLKIEQNSD